MDWWHIPVAIGVVALLWFLWVAAFHPAETVIAMRELDGYVPGSHDPGDAPEADTPTGGITGPPTGSDPPSEPASEPADSREDPQGAACAGPDVTADDGGIWIELDITPLFASSEHRSVVDLTEVEDPEPAG